MNKTPVVPLGQTSSNGRKYGALPDKQDTRDKLVKQIAGRPKPLPSHVDLSHLLGPVRDQGDLGACTGFAYAGIREFIFNKYDERLQLKILSPLYIYYKERELEGTIDQDAGAEPRDGCRVLFNFGVCLEAEDVYQPTNFAAKPTSEMESEAAAYKITAYHRANNLHEAKLAIASGFCPSIGFSVYESFESDQVAQTGMMPVPDTSKEQLLGGHEVFAFGYDDIKGALMCRNSWGADWGLTGNFYMPYTAVTPELVSDILVINPGKPWKVILQQKAA
jgi:C1A family cysteine protease